MSTDNLLLVTRDGWRHLSGGSWADVAPWPTLSQPTLVVTDFEDAALGSYRFDGGRRAYAAALVEKRARTEGLTDGAAHVILHRVQAQSGGLQTFHSVVPLELWQRTQQWAAQQRDHCIVLPLGGLLAAGVGVGDARVLRAGRALHCFGQTKAGLHYHSVNAMGRTGDDLLSAVRALAGLARADIAKGIVHPVEFGSLWAVDPALETELVTHWSAQTGGGAAALPVEPAGTAVTALPGLVERAGVGAAVNPPLARMAWWSERLVPGVATAVGVLALALGGFGLYVKGQARAEHDSAADGRREATALEARIAATNVAEIPQTFAPVAQLARTLGDGARYDPVAMLGLLRDVAGPGVRIQRLRLDPPAVGASGLGERSFQVDGVAEAGSVGAISRLLAALRDAGWTAQPVNAADAAAGAFSYRLTATPGPRG